MCIFKIHDLVTDVIGCFHEIYQWMTGIFQRFTRFRQANNTQFIGNSLKMLTFCIKESELPFLAGSRRRIWIFNNTCQHGISHDKSAHSPTLELMSQQTEGIGITFKMGDIVPELMTDLSL